ncbi:hypothetical protein AtNW77_Chr5g0114611 [Arabidopsis thaliana]
MTFLFPTKTFFTPLIPALSVFTRMTSITIMTASSVLLLKRENSSISPTNPEAISSSPPSCVSDICTRPNNISGPHYISTCTLQSLERLKDLCRIPLEIMVESKMPYPLESLEDHLPGYYCVYEIYFKGCGLTFPLPEALVRYLEALGIALQQLTPNLL